jgi:hypothetical protein
MEHVIRLLDTALWLGKQVYGVAPELFVAAARSGLAPRLLQVPPAQGRRADDIPAQTRPRSNQIAPIRLSPLETSRCRS